MYFNTEGIRCFRKWDRTLLLIHHMPHLESEVTFQWQTGGVPSAFSVLVTLSVGLWVSLMLAGNDRRWLWSGS